LIGNIIFDDVFEAMRRLEKVRILTQNILVYQLLIVYIKQEKKILSEIGTMILF